MRVGTRLVSCQFFAQTNQLELGWLIVGQVREGAVWNVFKKIIVVLYSVPLPRSRNMPTTNLAKVSSGHIERWIRCTNSRKYSLKNLFLLHSLARYYHVRSFLQKKLAVLRVWSLLYWPPHRFHRPWRQATQKIWPFRRTFLHETTFVVFWSFRPKATITRLAGGGGGGRASYSPYPAWLTLQLCIPDDREILYQAETRTIQEYESPEQTSLQPSSIKPQEKPSSLGFLVKVSIHHPGTNVWIRERLYSAYWHECISVFSLK